MKKTKNGKISFDYFLEKFPILELPVTLSDQEHHAFSSKNQTFSPEMIDAFIMPYQGAPADEFTEFVPCFRLPETQDFHALVFWKASLLNYAYYLITFSKKGKFIDQKEIAGTKNKENELMQSVATIEDDWIIYIVSGIKDTHESSTYSASTSKAHQLELLADGRIVFP